LMMGPYVASDIWLDKTTSLVQGCGTANQHNLVGHFESFVHIAAPPLAVDKG
jgi:hypothetical protein